jgi:chemotaxis protein MotB
MRKRKNSEHQNHERWLVSYADFITLMFAFFVVLYSSAQVDKRRVGQLAMAIQVAFQQMGIFDASNTKPAVSNTEPMPFSKVQMVENSERFQTLDRLVNAPRGSLSGSPDHPNLEEIRAELEKSLASQIQKRTVSITPTKEGLIVSLREIGFFDSGSTQLRPDAASTLAEFVAVVGPRRVRVRIEGHTDNVPIHSGRFRSNWELSTGRATEITELFIERYGMAPDRLSAAGYAEYHPVASNDTPEGRALNRRVDLIILNSNSDAASTTPAASAAPSGAGAPPNPAAAGQPPRP